MSIGERVSDPFYYVWEGIIKKPIIWVLLTVFCFGNSLLGISVNLILRKYAFFTQEPVMTYYPAFFNQYPLEISVLCFIIGAILMLFLAGYTYQIFQGNVSAPAIQNWGLLLLNGLKLTIVSFIFYIIPLLISFFFVLLPLYENISFMQQFTGGATNSASVTPEIFKFVGLMLGGSIISILAFILFWIFSIIGIIRFCRTESMGSAFEISEILQRIRNIGWVRYLGSLVIFIIIMVIFGIIRGIIGFFLLAIGFIFGFMFKGTFPIFMGISMIIGLLIESLIVVYSARYFSVLYDVGETDLVQEE